MDLKDRRVFERFDLEFPLSCSAGDGDTDNCVRAHDISADGIGISSDNEFRPGEVLKASFRVPSINKELPMHGRVIWSRKLGNRFRAGVSLDQIELMEVSAILRFLHAH
jgi:hypothetical protein